MGKRASILFRKTLPKEDRDQLRLFSEQLCEQVLTGRGFNSLITSDAQLQQLNRDFLSHDYPTDVLSFPSGEEVDLGELAISIDRAREQAAEQGHTLVEEIQILMLHGVLHLMGMDHETDRGSMRRAETKWRKHFGLSAGLIERTRK
jgi:probable rRNA maturation factor